MFLLQRWRLYSIKSDLKVKILEHFVITEKYIFGFESMKINKIVDPIRRERKEFSSLEIKKYLYVLCLIFYGLWVIGLGFRNLQSRRVKLFYNTLKPIFVTLTSSPSRSLKLLLVISSFLAFARSALICFLISSLFECLYLRRKFLFLGYRTEIVSVSVRSKFAEFLT